MDHYSTTLPTVTVLPSQGNLFSALPRQPRILTGEWDKESLPPREQVHSYKLPH